jgi:hypothetical protein
VGVGKVRTDGETEERPKPVPPDQDSVLDRAPEVEADDKDTNIVEPDEENEYG